MDRKSLLDKIICGDVRVEAQDLPSEFADCIVTSPPYYLQRDYEDARQVGLETTPGDYVSTLVGIFAEGRRILKKGGTLWLVLGDKYISGQLTGIPWRVALALQDDGWLLRSDIIWHKPNAMPHPASNRPTTDHEYVFLFSREREYFYDIDAIREPHVTLTDKSRMRGGRGHFGKRNGTPEKGKNKGNSNLHKGRWDHAFHPLGRNKRTVWSVPLGKFRGAHFAVFPEGLIEPCILAGCPKGGLVLDPFFGSGTVGVVAARLSRHYLGIELNPRYVEMARKRMMGVQAKLGDG